MDLAQGLSLIFIGIVTASLVFKVLSDEMYKRSRQALRDDREEQKAQAVKKVN